MTGLFDGAALEAAGAIAAQDALRELRSVPDAEDVLITALHGSNGAWRLSEAWLRGFLRVIEKKICSDGVPR